MKATKITKHCLSTTKIIRLDYDTKWKVGMQRIRRKWQKCELFIFRRNCRVFPIMGTPGYRSVILRSRRYDKLFVIDR